MVGRYDWLTTTEVARMLDVHVTTVRKWCRQGKIKCVYLPGGKIRIPRDVVEKIIRGELNEEYMPSKRRARKAKSLAMLFGGRR